MNKSITTQTTTTDHGERIKSASMSPRPTHPSNMCAILKLSSAKQTPNTSQNMSAEMAALG